MTDDAVRDCLAARVMDTLVPQLHGGTVTPLARNVFSFVFAVEPRVGDHPGVFVKIPKEDLRRRPPHVLPLTPGDLALGRAEYESLRYLEVAWKAGDERVHFVRPLAYFPDLNAVVTVRAHAREGLDSFRREAIRERVFGIRSASERLRRIAMALRRFHERAAEPAHLDVGALQRRVSDYVSRLRRWGVSRGYLDRFIGQFIQRCPSADVHVTQTTTLKGIDIRNVLISDDDTLHLLDPGAIKRAPVEADLARFLITWRILFWGSTAFAIGAAPPPRTERAFLEAYGAGEPRALGLMLIKELLKHWFTAHESLRIKAWGSATTTLVAAVYIDPFYRRQLRAELAKLTV